ncbi:hypothetical protein Efla_006300 [Eimeria flavescens]
MVFVGVYFQLEVGGMDVVNYNLPSFFVILHRSREKIRYFRAVFFIMMATLGESKSARKHVGTAPQVLGCESDIGDQEQFIPIEKLQNVGINAADINKLRAAGYCTVLSVIQTTVGEEHEVDRVEPMSVCPEERPVAGQGPFRGEGRETRGGSDEAGALQLVHKWRRTCDETSESGEDYHRFASSSQLDLLLGGGVETMSITEIFGENRCGKTQICHTLCVTAQLPREMNGGCGKVCYIDTEATFRPEKICLIAERFGLDGAGVLDNIMYARAYTTEHMHQLLTVAAAKVSKKINESRQQTFSSLVIVDSIMALFRVDFSGRGELADRQQKLNKMLSSMMKMSEQYNIAVVLTNQVMSDPGGGLTFVANPTKPVGGHVLGHASTTRLSLRKGKGDQRICKVYDAPNLPESECIFQLASPMPQTSAQGHLDLPPFRVYFPNLLLMRQLQARKDRSKADIHNRQHRWTRPYAAIP